MKIRLPELEDYKWFPAFLRKMQLDYIGWLVDFFGIYKSTIPLIERLSDRVQQKNWVDLCAGSGNPTIGISSALSVDYKIILTDLYPTNSSLKSSNISWNPDAVDAIESISLNGFRTMFNAFHHFDDHQKTMILKNHAQHGLFIAEILQPSLFELIKIGITTTIGQILFRPFVRPFSWNGIIFTYLIPINLFTVTWDGIASVLKSSTILELKTLAERALPDGFQIEIGRSGKFGMKVNYLLIIPKK
jgi:hypothetical protein